MKILIAHNRYQEKGGEDYVVAEEAAMLARHGHTVELFLVDNDAIDGPASMLRAAVDSFYSIRSASKITAVMDSFAPDLVHVHNFLPNLSPSVFFATQRKHVPVVQTLHNYRMLCANALLYRDGHVCEECVSARSFLPGIRHACYRSSRLGSAVVGGTMSLHAALRTWSIRVDRYIALTQFAAHKLSATRVPAEHIRIKPNFVAATSIGEGGGGFALFAGRLSPEKGLQTLMDADRLGLLQLPVRIAGDGPLMPAIQEAAARPGSKLQPLGATARPALQELMRSASVLLVPSVWYEPFGMVVIEALAAGLPVACSRIGGLPELVEDGVSGATFTPGDPVALSQAANHFATVTPDTRKLQQGARQRYEDRFSEQRNYEMLLSIYRELVP